MTNDEYLKDISLKSTKWHELRRTQLSITNNLVLTFSVAILGFVAKEYIMRYESHCLKIGFISILASVASAILMSLSRLYDYKYTYLIIKYKKQQLRNYTNENEIKIKDLRKTVMWLGNRTWNLLWFQLSLFFLGCVLIGAFILSY